MIVVTDTSVTLHQLFERSKAEPTTELYDFLESRGCGLKLRENICKNLRRHFADGTRCS